MSPRANFYSFVVLETHPLLQVPLQFEEDVHLAPTEEERGSGSCGATISNLAIGSVGFVRSFKLALQEISKFACF